LRETVSNLSEKSRDSFRKICLIPELKLAIEYDEVSHPSRIEEDTTRQQVIEAELGCRFIRYKDNFRNLLGLDTERNYIHISILI
jgi:very-short-patch-repair endonuclease